MDKCQICGGEALLEVEEGIEMLGDICDICDRWVCQDCLDHSKSGIDYDNICVECAEKTIEDLSRGRWVEEVYEDYSAVPFMANIIALNPNVYAVGYHKNSDGDALVELDIGERPQYVADGIRIDEVNFCHAGKSVDILFDIEGSSICLNFYNNNKDNNILWTAIRDNADYKEIEKRLNFFIDNYLDLDKVYNFKYNTIYRNF